VHVLSGVAQEGIYARRILISFYCFLCYPRRMMGCCARQRWQFSGPVTTSLYGPILRFLLPPGSSSNTSAELLFPSHQSITSPTRQPSTHSLHLQIVAERHRLLSSNPPYTYVDTFRLSKTKLTRLEPAIRWQPKPSQSRPRLLRRRHHRYSPPPISRPTNAL
jgi:hypothetical protein